MVISCSSYGCSNKWSKETDVHFHKFPFRSKKLCEKWASALKRKNFVPTKASLVCSDHFTEHDYVSKPGLTKKRLKKDAVPSIFNFPVYDHLPIPHLTNLSSIGAVENILKVKKKKRGRKPKKKLKEANPNRTNVKYIESFIDEFEVNLFNESEIKYNPKYEDNSIRVQEIIVDDFKNVEAELADADEEDKCYILGSIWGERLKLLPLDVRPLVRRIVENVFVEARKGTLNNKLNSFDVTKFLDVQN